MRPELEVFDTGQLVMVKDLIDEGLIDDPVLIQLCMGIRYGAPDDPGTLLALVELAPGGGGVLGVRASAACNCPTWPWRCWPAATSASGWRTTCTWDRAQRATNGELVERATTILNAMNVRVLGPEDVRERLALRRRG